MKMERTIIISVTVLMIKTAGEDSWPDRGAGEEGLLLLLPF